MLALRWSGTWSGPLFIGFALSSLAQQTTPASPAPEQSAKPAPNATVRLIPRSDEERQHTSEASHHIILNVLVTDPSGKAVTGLSQDDFTILDNGQPQKISSFRPLTGNAKDQPLHVILLLDAVNNSARNFASERKAVEKFLAQSRGSLPWPHAPSPRRRARVPAPCRPQPSPARRRSTFNGRTRISVFCFPSRP